MGWTTRKVAGMMTVNLEVEARDEGMFTSLKTKLKNTDNLLLYNGVTKTKGLSDDEVGFYRLRGLSNQELYSLCNTSTVAHTMRKQLFYNVIHSFPLWKFTKCLSNLNLLRTSKLRFPSTLTIISNKCQRLPKEVKRFKLIAHLKSSTINSSWRRAAMASLVPVLLIASKNSKINFKKSE